MSDSERQPEKNKGFYLRNSEEEGEDISQETKLPDRSKNPNQNNPGKIRKGKTGSNPRGKLSKKRNESPRFVDEETSTLAGPPAQGQSENEELPQSQKQKEEDHVLPDEISSSSATMGTKPSSQDESGLIEDVNPHDDISDEKSTLEELESRNFQDDEELEQEIQEAIEKEDSISSAAKSIQVSVENGKATLVGIVPSEQEKMTVGDKAAAFVGFGKVINELEVEENTP
jgi:hypothetical protein